MRPINLTILLISIFHLTILNSSGCNEEFDVQLSRSAGGGAGTKQGASDVEVSRSSGTGSSFLAEYYAHFGCIA